MRKTLVVLLILASSSATARDLTLNQALQLAEAHSLALKKSQSAANAAASSLDASQAGRLPTFSATALASYVSEVPMMNLRPYGTHETYQTDLRLSLPIFTGGRLSGGIAASQANADYAEALQNLSADQTVYLTRLEYYSLYRADKLLEAAQASLKRAESIRSDVASLYAAGAADSVDILEASLANSRADFAVKQAITARRSSELRLLTYLGLEPTETLNLTDSLPEPKQESWSADVAPAKPELTAAEAIVKLNKSRRRLAEAEYFPALSVFGGYSYGKPNLDRFNSTWNDYFTVGANLTWSFNVGGATVHSYRAASYNLHAAEYERDQTAENLRREAQLAVEKLRLALQQYNNASEQYKIALSNYRLAVEQHRNGMLSSNRLITIEADLTGAEASASAALIDFYAAHSAYDYAIGSENIRKGL